MPWPYAGVRRDYRPDRRVLFDRRRELSWRPRQTWPTLHRVHVPQRRVHGGRAPVGRLFRTISARRLSNLEGVNVTRSDPIVEVEADIADVVDSMLTTNLRIDYLTETNDSSAIEYFDGLRTTSPLYVFEDDFGPQTFDESFAELNQPTRKAFSETIDRLGLEIENPEQTTGSEDELEQTYERAFQ
jgi:hypothetical protein